MGYYRGTLVGNFLATSPNSVDKPHDFLYNISIRKIRKGNVKYGLNGSNEGVK